MFVLLILGLIVGCLIVVPLLLIGLVLRLVLGLVLLPFQIAGFAIRLTLGLVVALVGVILAGAVLLIPLLPIIALVGGIWLIFRLSRRRAPAQLLSN
jgi:hypothetical protein